MNIIPEEEYDGFASTRAGRHDLSPTQKVSKLRFQVEKATGEKAELILPKDSTTEAGTGVKPVCNHPPSDDGDGEWNEMVARLLTIVSKNANTQQPRRITIRETRDGVVREMIMEPTA